MHQRAMTAISGAVALLVILLMVQIWLLTATLESFLAGHRGTALPAALISGVLFLACMGIYLLVDRLDREARKD
jgi:Cu/Ag efflux pump CusA